MGGSQSVAAFKNFVHMPPQCQVSIAAHDIVVSESKKDSAESREKAKCSFCAKRALVFARCTKCDTVLCEGCHGLWDGEWKAYNGDIVTKGRKGHLASTLNGAWARVGVRDGRPYYQKKVTFFYYSKSAGEWRIAASLERDATLYAVAKSDAMTPDQIPSGKFKIQSSPDSSTSSKPALATDKNFVTKKSKGSTNVLLKGREGIHADKINGVFQRCGSYEGYHYYQKGNYFMYYYEAAWRISENPQKAKEAHVAAESALATFDSLAQSPLLDPHSVWKVDDGHGHRIADHVMEAVAQ